MSDYYLDTVARVADLPLFRRADPPTSKAAGIAARETGLVGRHEQLILKALEQGPGTKDEIAARCGLTDDMVIRRMAKLMRDRLVELTGERRRTPRGQTAQVWRAVR